MFHTIREYRGGSWLSLTGRQWLALSMCIGLLSLVPVLVREGVWQELFFRSRVIHNAWWVLPLAMAIEYPAYRSLTRLAPAEAAALTLAANTVSFFVGVIPQYPTLLLEPGPAGVAIICVTAIVAAAATEWLFIGALCRGAWTRQNFSTLLLVNILSVMLMILAAWYFA